MPADPDSPAETHPSRSALIVAPAVAIFIGAFLLFQVQLLLGKRILPMFGGAPAVWTACLLVYQVLLLAGYAYAHTLAARFSMRAQVRSQFFLLGVSAIALAILSRAWPAPILPGADWRPLNVADPTWSIIGFLLAAIGLPFFLLSTTSPLMQHWIARAEPGRSPYRLYALSNAGSLLGLLSYPLLVEPNLRLQTQARIWSAGYVLFGCAYAVCAREASRRAGRFVAPAKETELRRDPAAEIRRSLPTMWVSLAACASVLLLATTNFICQEVAVIPFLWVLPLCLYLLSFILCFESDRWYRRELFHPLFAIAAGFVILVTLPDAGYSYMAQLAASSALLFAGCMVCHGEAARARPSAGRLTYFYLCISIGGALGGVFVSLVAPRIFPTYWEFPIGILGCAILLLWVTAGDPDSWLRKGSTWFAAATGAGIVLLSPRVLAPVWERAAKTPAWAPQTIAAILAGIALLLYVRQRRSPETAGKPWLVRLATRVGLILVTAGLAIPQKAEFYHVIARSRNFYGVLSVIDAQPEDYLALRHGRTVHGFQYRDPKMAHIPTGYYGEHSGANIFIRNAPQHPLRVGLIGMGAGTLAALGQPGDVFLFYEINQDVWRWSDFSGGKEPYFTYIKDSAARVEVILGDGRLEMEREAARGDLQKLDALVLDAFSSDAIPMHLLTREAFAVYLRHLRGPESVIAVHISNQALDLRPVLAGIAQEFSFHAMRIYPLELSGQFLSSDWILLSQSKAALDISELKRYAAPFPADAKPNLWTDDYSNLWSVLRQRWP